MVIYDQQAKNRLKDKQGYELWLLIFLRGIEYQDGVQRETLTIRENGTTHGEIVISESIGSRKAEGVIKSIYPLIFTSAFKLLDLVFEWILEGINLVGSLIMSHGSFQTKFPN